MKVLFVYPDIRGALRIRVRGYFYNGLACLSAVIKKHGYEVELLHYLHEPLKDEFIADIERQQPEVVAYSTTTNMFPFVRQWSRWCRDSFPHIFQICGGVHPTLNAESSLQSSDLDAVCIGEGEWPLLELCKSIEEGKDIYSTIIKNIVFKKRNASIKRNDLRLVMVGEELDTLPFPDRFLFDNDKITDPKRPIVIASRGCPYNCTYCCNAALRSLFLKAKGVRMRSVNGVIGELKYIRNTFPDIEGFNFDDDIFGIKLEWLNKFIKIYKKEIRLPFSCNLRANLVSKEIVDLLADGGCDGVAMGVETGNQDLRKNLLGRDMKDDTLINAFQLVEDVGISAHAFNMVGLPHETMKNSLETVKLNTKLKKKRWHMRELRITIFYPYKGTYLYAEAAKHNMLTNKDVVNYSDDTILKLKTMSSRQVRFMARYFRVLVMIYHFLSMHLGIFGRILTAGLDRLLVSGFADYILFPIINRSYPIAVKMARFFMFQK